MQNTSKIKAIVFDWDGVIVDSMPIIAKGIQATAASYGVHLSVDDVIAKYIQPREAFYKSIGIEPENKEELVTRHSTHISKHFSQPKLFDDVVPTLARLKADGIKIGVVSHAKKPRVESEVKALGLQSFFDSENIVGEQRNKAEKLLSIIKQFGITPAELLFVGDLPSDITTAKKVGAKSAGISRHESGKARLKAENPDYFLDSLLDLLKI